MKRKFTKLMAAFALLFMFSLQPIKVWADEVTILPTDGTPVENSDYTITKTPIVVSVTASTLTSEQIRVFKNQTLTVSGATITGIEFTCTANGTAKYGPGCFTTDDNGYTYESNGPHGTWSGSSNSVTFTAATNQVRITQIVVTYTPSGQTPTYTVTYDCNGGTSGCPSNVTGIEAGTTIELAGAPSRTDYNFNGWSDGINTYEAGDEYQVNSNVTFTAQWELDVDYLFYESFDECNGTGGNDNQWSGSIASSNLVPDNEGWTFVNGKGANKCAKFGTGSGLGSAQTPSITHTGNATLTFKAAAWNGNSESTTLKISATSGTLSASTVTLVKGAWTNYTIDIIGITASTQIKFEGNAASNSRFFLDEVMVVEAAPSTEPYITADDVDITYNATSGSIAYTINNSIEGGTVSAATESDWLTLGQGTTSPISFTCTANQTGTERTATVTLTYNYNRATVTKDVIITQAGDPNATDNISDITEAGSYVVKGKIFAKSSRGFVLGDGTGYVYVYKTTSDFDVNDYVKVSGAVTTQYNNIFEFQSSATLTEVDAFEIADANPTVMDGSAITSFVDYTGARLSSYVQYEGALAITPSGTNTYYNITIDGTDVKGSISYPTQDLSSYDGKNVVVIGYYVGKSTSNNVTYFNTMLESISSTEPSITVTPDNVAFNATGEGGFQMETLTLAYENIEVENYQSFAVQFYDAEGEEQDDPEWVVVGVTGTNAAGYVVNCAVGDNQGEAHTAYFKVWALGDEDYVYSNLVTVTQAAAPVMALYTYSINGAEGETLEAEVGTPLALENGTDLNNDFTFAGWTLDPNDVENLITQYTFNENDVVTFYAVYAHTTGGAGTSKDGASYVKVTSTDNLENGNYLIVYEEGALAFDGGRTNEDGDKIDAASNTISIFDYMNEGVIASNTTTDAAIFTIEEYNDGYSIQSASGFYIGQTSNANGMAVSDETVYENAISFNDGDADIVSGGAYMRYNATSGQDRFRYFKSGTYTAQKAIQLYKYTDGGGTPTPQTVTAYYTRVFLNETVAADITIAGPSIVPSGETLDMGSYNLENNLDYSKLIIEDGGQLKIANTVNGTIQKNVAGYGNSTNGKYVLLATPASMDACNNTGMWPTTGNDHQAIQANIDFYSFDQSAEMEWQNFKYGYSYFAGPYLMKRGLGYLYANPNDVTLTLQTRGYSSPGIDYQAYPFEPTNAAYTVPTDDLGYTATATWAGWNLVGNPFTCDAYINRTYFRMNEDGDAIVEGSGAIKPCEGVFVVVTDTDNTVTFSDTQNVKSSRLFINLNGNDKLMDRVSLRFDESNNIKKFVLNENAAKLYIPQGKNDYAVVRSAAQGEMPVSFRASENGTYTLAVEAENVEMNYLHLIDNMTGMDVDLLQTPNYTFEARTNDYTSRFRLVFSANGTTDNEVETFAYFNGSNWTVNNLGEATLQIVDVTGRTVSSETINGNATISLNQTPGVYMFRLVSGNGVKVQKVVVK